MPKRIPGFDLARAYAIFGMYIVNFNIVYGNYQDGSPLGRVLSLFSGNSSIAFVILAGMGCSLLSWRPEATPAERAALRSIIVRRSWFLFALGLLLYPWWPGDILHFYGGYMHLAAFCLFVPGRRLLWLAAGFVAGFHLLMALIPYETGWDYRTFHYLDFWTLPGFLRNTFYNGWNPIFPWAALFFLGMWLGRLDWHSGRTKVRALWTAAAVFIPLEVLMWLAGQGRFSADVNFFFLADYVPPFLPFLAAGASSAVLVIVACLWLGERFEASPWARTLAATGRMTLTHYILHLTLGMVALSALSGQAYGRILTTEGTTSPLHILAFSASWFLGSAVFSYLWSKKFKNGPMEWAMRRICG